MKFRIVVKPNSKKESVLEKNEGLEVSVKAPPTEGKANLAVIQLLAQYFHVPQSNIHFKHGLKSKQKTIEIQ